MQTPPTVEHSLCRHTAYQWWNARGMQRQHGPWVPTVISHRMAAVTEWVFSPLNSETALCVFLIFSLFTWCVGKEWSPLCQATRLKSKVGSGCIWVVCVCMCVSVWDWVREREMRTQCTNCLDPCCSMIPHTNSVSWEKYNITAAKFVDSLLRISKLEQENDKITFPLLPSLFCGTHSFSCT